MNGLYSLTSTNNIDISLCELYNAMSCFCISVHVHCYRKIFYSLIITLPQLSCKGIFLCRPMLEQVAHARSVRALYI